MVDKKREILPINDKPSVITCIHHAYPCSIIESKEVAILKVENYEKAKWQYSSDDIQVIQNQDDLILLERDKTINDFSFWRICKNQDELIVEIKYVKIRDKGYYFDFFLFSDDVFEEMKKEDKSFGFRSNMYGIFIKKRMYPYDSKAFCFMKIQINENVMKGFTSCDGENWAYISDVQFPFSVKKCNVNLGVHFHMGQDYFEPWKNMNFIQMCYNADSICKGIHMDYFFFPRKNVDNGYSWYSNFLDTLYDVLYEIKDLFPTLYDYIKWNIQHMYYVELCVDEFYLPGRMHYQRFHYNHYNLIYGYDDVEKMFYVLGYGKNSTPVCNKVPYSLITYETLTSEKIIRFKYSINVVSDFVFKLPVLKDNLKELVNDIDSCKKFSNILTGEKLYYGLSVIKKLVVEVQEHDRIRTDRRISFFLLEHSQLMRSRLDYLEQEGYLSKELHSDLCVQCEEIIKLAQLIMFIVIKNMIKEEKTDRIDTYLLQLYDAEKQFIQSLLECL